MRSCCFALFLFALACGDDVAVTDGGTDEPCRIDSDCDDTVFCNGRELCRPGSAGADARGCQGAPDARCRSTQSCDERADRCLTDCLGVRDADGDGHDAIECGGDDCDDADADRFPGNPEICDPGHDEDCSAITVGELDRDGDGAFAIDCCNGATCGGDCDDTTIARAPTQVEICDGQDNDCDGSVDEERNVVSWYADADGDGFGTPDDAIEACEPQGGRSLLPIDCDDEDADISPLAEEVCDGFDNDCDGSRDDGCTPGDFPTFEEPRPCAADDECEPDEICFAHRGSASICHRTCTEELNGAPCGRVGADIQRRCLRLRDSDDGNNYLVCSHACDNFADLGCPAGSTCDVFDGGPTGTVPYLECRIFGTGMDGADCGVDGYECAPRYTCVDSSGGVRACRQVCLVGEDAMCDAFTCQPEGTPWSFAGRHTGRCVGSP